MFLLVYRMYLQPSYVQNAYDRPKSGYRSAILPVLGISFVLKVVMSCFYVGFPNDMNCFFSWANRAVEVGFSGFYTTDVFTDYPPGYIYILYVVGLFQKFFGVQSYQDMMAVVLVKLPAILCDLAGGYVIFKIAAKKFSKKASIFCCLIYVFNPCVVLDSSIWGQVDGVYTLLVLLMCYFLTERKHERAIICFALGILIKPQTLFFAPVLFFACVEEAFTARESGKLVFRFHTERFVSLLIYAVGSIVGMLLLVLPFGVGTIVSQYVDTVGSYEYATVNAYNIWMLFGKNWVAQDTTLLGISYAAWGYAAILLTIVASGILFFRMKKSEGKVYLTAAVINMFIFMFSVRMHERYMFPVLVLLLCVYLSRPTEKMMFVYILYSVTSFLNAAYVLFYYDANNYVWDDPIPRIISAGALAVTVFFGYVVTRYYLCGHETAEEEYQVEHRKTAFEEKAVRTGTIAPSRRFDKLTKKDYIIMLAITLVYAVIALYNLGFMYAPESQWSTEEEGTIIDLDFGAVSDITKISVYLGNYENRKFQIEYRNDESGDWNRLENSKQDDNSEEDAESRYTFEISSVFAWNSLALDLDARYVRLISTSEKAVLNEVVFLNADGVRLTPVNATEYTGLFDEQDMYEPKESYRSGTYFDEIYHARTAYEFLHGLYSYEWTHPPLGKILIAVGVKIFGMNPFGWRIMGTLFGIAMLPVIYLFARRFFKKRWFATMACLLFACDFMHFAQTRIATIDVYVTFFILLMYYFMYRYVAISFYDTKLSKTFVPLGLCGITMGLAVASKMTGVYAAVGLAVIFFANLYKRYQEYCYAKQDPDGMTNGISHAYVIENFASLTWKTILFCILVFILIPACIYTLSYLPFVSTPGLGLIARMLKNQGDMFNYHANLTATHPFSSNWYQWPIVYRPIWYYSGDLSTTVAEGISSFGNPFIWWAGVPAFIMTIVVAYKKKDRFGAFLVIGYLAQYLPWMLVTRCTFIYHYFPSVPFVILMIVYCADFLVKRNKSFKIPIGIYIGACVVLFFMFYPVLSGMTISKEYVTIFLRWMGSWVLLRQ